MWSCLDVSLSFEDNMAILESQDHARYPVIDGNFENLLGVINSRQWLAHALKGQRDLKDVQGPDPQAHLHSRKPSPAWSCWRTSSNPARP